MFANALRVLQKHYGQGQQVDGVDNKAQSGYGFAQRLFDPMGVEMEYNANQAAIDREFAASEAQKAREWSEHMRDSSYGSTVKQLRELGLNPYVALSGFSQASTPSGASASSSGARVGSSASLVSTLANSAFNLGASIFRS